MADDPINPKHYAGTECADIGEHLSANSYQVLKYNWRLGKKDTATIELGKSIWYLDREIGMARTGWRPANLFNLPSDEWFFQRYCQQTDFVQSVAINLISWNRCHDLSCLLVLRGILETVLTTFRENN